MCVQWFRDEVRKTRVVLDRADEIRTVAIYRIANDPSEGKWSFLYKVFQQKYLLFAYKIIFGKNNAI